MERRGSDAVDGVEVELLASIRGLAALLPESQDFASQITLDVANGLTETEANALLEFELAGQKCLSKLTGPTLQALARVGAGKRAIARTRTSTGRLAPSGGKKGASEPSDSVYELFEKFDKDQDGILSLDEFREAFRQLAGNQFGEAQMETLIEAADVNRDGAIDIHEFTVWLYGSASGKKLAEPQEVGSAEAQQLQEKLEMLENELRVKDRAISRMEESHEEEMDVTHDFWKEVAKHAVLTIDKKVDLERSEWLGNGKYGFVLKAKRREDNREVVVKMMGVRWAHLAVKEWQHGSQVGKHPNIVDYEDVMLHADDDHEIASLLKTGYESGKLKSRTQRKNFPDRFICLTQEFMNRGTVQNWLDKESLTVGGMLNVAEKVACALAFMHQGGATHNDIKPENVMLHQDEDGKVIVKLGDLGLATKSQERAADYWQYGMTLFCMCTGERFGSRKYTNEASDGIVQEATSACEQAAGDDALSTALQELPRIIEDVFSQRVEFDEISERKCFQDWAFFDGDESGEVHKSQVGPSTRREEPQSSRVEDG